MSKEIRYTHSPASHFSYVVTPARRSSAEAIHLMLTHALGEAGAPFVVGFLIDAMEKQVLNRSLLIPTKSYIISMTCQSIIG